MSGGDCDTSGRNVCFGCVCQHGGNIGNCTEDRKDRGLERRAAGFLFDALGRTERKGGNATAKMVPVT